MFECVCSINNTNYCFFSSNEAVWSNNGCVRSEGNMTYSVCLCNHLTNFAILMQVVPMEVWRFNFTAALIQFSVIYGLNDWGLSVKTHRPTLHCFSFFQFNVLALRSTASDIQPFRCSHHAHLQPQHAVVFSRKLWWTHRMLQNHH